MKRRIRLGQYGFPSPEWADVSEDGEWPARRTPSASISGGTTLVSSRMGSSPGSPTSQLRDPRPGT